MEDRRLYYQYLGFLNTFNLFNKSLLDIDNFEVDRENISYEKFKNFKLDVKVPLGKRVEYFFEFYIQSSEKYRVLYKNVQIIRDKTTLGEFDFFIENTDSKEIYHIELVYKFYIYVNHADEIKRYVAPNNHDTLEDKIDKLKNKQFPLLHEIDTKEELKNINTKEVKQKLCFLGNVFIPNGVEIETNTIDKRCINGTYLDLSRFLDEYKCKNYGYYLPQKQDWLIEAKYFDTWFDFETISLKIREFFVDNNSTFLLIKTKNGFKRMFILNSSSSASSIDV